MKIKAFTVVMLFLLCLSYSHGQDIIKKRNGETIEALIVDISPGVIKYRKFDKPLGSVYSLARDQVESISYQNGKTVTFEEKEEKKIPVRQDTSGMPPKPSPRFGWHLGIGGSSILGDIEGAKMQLATTIGATFTIPAGKNNTILLGFDILSLGCVLEDIDVIDEYGIRHILTGVNQDMGYLGLLVGDRFFFNDKLNYFIEGGGYGSILVNASITAENYTEIDENGYIIQDGPASDNILDLYRPYDFGLLFGFGGRIPLGKNAKWHITLEARMNYGLTDIADPDPAVYLGVEDYEESNIYGFVIVGVDIPTKSQD